MSSKNIIEIENLHKSYSNHKALNNINLTIEKSKIFGLLGPNGAGKTTLIRIINQILKPDSGTCLLYTSPSPRDKRQSRMPSSA